VKATQVKDLMKHASTYYHSPYLTYGSIQGSESKSDSRITSASYSSYKGNKEEQRRQFRQKIVVICRALCWTIVGLVLIVVSIYPLIEAFHKLSTTADIKIFYFAMILLPICTRLNHGINLLNMSLIKSKKSSSLVF